MGRNYTKEQTYEKIKKNEESSRPETIPWKEVSSEVLKVESTDSEDAKSAEYVSTSTGNDAHQSQSSKKRIIFHVQRHESDVMPAEFCHLGSSTLLLINFYYKSPYKIPRSF